LIDKVSNLRTKSVEKPKWVRMLPRAHRAGIIGLVIFRSKC